MVGTGAVFTVKAIDPVGPVAHELVPVTVTFPDVAEAEKLTVIAVVPAPAVIVAPAGTVQL